ncbi:hypothetical protein EW146_g5117 [Bondarzewia mesenterica]|uniref:Chromosome transmission fidelity protein 8 n=1 Tax=Bondarzewia mesenterica TaxID=1095465 RepID=A0A4S4LSE5_9AGAM|nr:hypothetical protein EW146_g5117 [Bondarzewia mesenterica]
MIIPITLPSPSSNNPNFPPTVAKLGSSELVLIELQGDLETSGDPAGQTIGTLCISPDNKTKPTLRIGHNLLEGKIITLPKPLAVLHRSSPPSSPSSFTSTSYAIAAVIRTKLVFAKRPMPIVGAPRPAAVDGRKRKQP